MKIEQDSKPPAIPPLPPATACAALVRRIGWHNWQEAATLIKTTKNGWRVRWETGYRTGKTVNLTNRNWVVKQHNAPGERPATGDTR